MGWQMQDEPETNGETSGDGHVDAAPLIDAFGGIRPMASKLGVPVSTVQGWRERNAIPVARLDAIRAAAAKHDISLTPEHVVLQVGAPPKDDGRSAATDRAAEPAKPQASRIPSSRGDPLKSEPRKKTRSGRWSDGGFPPIAGIAGVAFVVALVAMFLAVVATRQVREGLVVVAEDGASLELANQLSNRMAALEDAGDSTSVRVAVLETLTAENAALSAEVAALTERLTAAEGALVEAGSDDGRAEALAEITARLTALETAMSEGAPLVGVSDPELVADLANVRQQGLTTADAIADVSEGLERLADRIGIVERARPAGVAGTGGVDAVVVAQGLAVVRLRQGLSDGLLDKAIAQAATVFAGDPPLSAMVDDIAAVAARGVVTRAVLADDFGRIRVDTARPTAGDETGWLARAQARVADVVTVQRTDVAAVDVMDADAGALAQARQRLDAGDLAGAVDVMNGQGGEAAGWLAAARQRLALEAAVDTLEAAVLDRLAAG